MTSEDEAGFQGKQAAQGGQAALHAALLGSRATIPLVGLLHIDWLLLVSAILGVLLILALQNESFAKELARRHRCWQSALQSSRVVYKHGVVSCGRTHWISCWGRLPILSWVALRPTGIVLLVALAVIRLGIPLLLVIVLLWIAGRRTSWVSCIEKLRTSETVYRHFALTFRPNSVMLDLILPSSCTTTAYNPSHVSNAEAYLAQACPDPFWEGLVVSTATPPSAPQSGNLFGGQK